MLQLDESMNFLEHFYQHELTRQEALIFDEAVDITIKNKLIVKWALMEEEQLTKLNLGNKEIRRLYSLMSLYHPNLLRQLKHCYKIIWTFLLGTIRN